MRAKVGLFRQAGQTGWLGALVFLASLLAPVAASLPGKDTEQGELKNPLAGNAAAVKEGESLFRTNCSPCHGLNARGGGKGPDLTSGRWTHGETDAAIFRTITQGVPGTLMPASALPDDETWAIIAYLRSLNAAARPRVVGNRAAGESLFLGKGACARCHMVNGRGGRLGPDLSRVGSARSLQYLIDSIREPSKDLSDGLSDPNNHYGNPLVYDTVTVLTYDGGQITGIAKNEDAFSIQLMDASEQLHLLLKRDLKAVTHEHKSLMPAYTQEMLSDAELRDLLVYLDSLRGP